MGKASRWLKGFLGMKKDRDNENVVDASLAASGSFKREKKRWSFSVSRNFDSAAAKAPARVSASDAFWVMDAEEEKQHSKHAMAVAAATAAAADAAVAAAEAAVAVVRLTGKRRGAGGKEARAAVKIQCVFRGFLARKALRALKGLVKIQALVRGYLVRKQAATALSRMQTLIRAQETIWFERARRSLDKGNIYPLENQVENNMESFGVNDELENCLKIVKVDKVRRRSRSHRISDASFRESSGSEGIPHSSPFSCPMPTRASTPKLGHLRGPDWCFSSYDEFRFKTNESTCELQNVRPRAPSTPTSKTTRGGGGGIFHPYSSAPSYMANTTSFKAKVRSQSAPRHREAGSKKRVPLSEILNSRNAMMGGVRMEKSCSHLEEIFE